jgi:DICT domain-containing protein
VKTFSLFEEALKMTGASAPAEDLTQVTYISRRDFDERETFSFVASEPCLEYVSLMIENAVLLRTHRAGRVYAGFERLSRMEAVISRYLRIADVSERVYVFGEPDWKPPRHPNMRVIALPHDSRIGREWFVIANSPVLKVALAAVALNLSGDASANETRNFRALKTSNPVIIDRLAAITEELIDFSLAA